MVRVYCSLLVPRLSLQMPTFICVILMSLLEAAELPWLLLSFRFFLLRRLVVSFSSLSCKVDLLQAVIQWSILLGSRVSGLFSIPVTLIHVLVFLFLISIFPCISRRSSRIVSILLDRYIALNYLIWLSIGGLALNASASSNLRY